MPFIRSTRRFSSSVSAQNAGVIDDTVDAPEDVERGFDDGRSTGGLGNGIRVCHRLTAFCANFVNDLVRGICVASVTFGCAAEVIDDDLRTFSRGQQCNPTDYLHRSGAGSMQRHGCAAIVEHDIALDHRRMK